MNKKRIYIDECVPAYPIKFEPKVIFFSDICDKNINIIIPAPRKKDWRNIGKLNGDTRKSYNILEYYCGFDIESTNYQKNDNNLAYMYIWQFSINDWIILGRTWDEWLNLMKILVDQLNLNDSSRLIVYVHNLSYEFQFFRKITNISNFFAKDMRECINCCIMNNCIEFRDSYALSGMGLESLAKQFCGTRKIIGGASYEYKLYDSDLNFQIFKNEMAEPFDYQLIRNSITELSPDELAYCINDVAILAEYSHYLFHTYVHQCKRLPLTLTGILRGAVQSRFADTCKKNHHIRDAIIAQLPTDIDEYNIMMKYLFRGGYTHANALRINQILKNVKGYDITSSYISCIFHKYYPMDKFIKLDGEFDKDYMNSKLKNYAWYAKAHFIGLKNITKHSIESFSKSLEYDDCNGDEDVANAKYGIILDNGRVAKADSLTVYITNVDYNTYLHFYKWDAVKFSDVHYARYGVLPNYITQPLQKFYLIKSKLKKSGFDDKNIEYKIAKDMGNGAYGMCCTKLHQQQWIYNNESGNYELSPPKSLDEILGLDRCKKNFYALPKIFLAPQWGIWISAYARNNLLRMVKKINNGDDVGYCDTDSIYALNWEKYDALFDEYNKKIRSTNDRIFSSIASESEIEYYSDLGEFSEIGIYEKFKSLGAKRYIKSNGNDIDVKISGLPIGALENYCRLENKNIYDAFDQYLDIPIGASMKNAHDYNDFPHSDIITDYQGNSCKMSELSSVGIYEIPFKMKMNEIYMHYIANIQRKYERPEIIDVDDDGGE